MASPDIERARDFMAQGVPTITLRNPGKIAAYGPNRSSRAVFAGTENGYGGVVYLLTDAGIVQIRHLTGISAEIMNSLESHTSLPNGVFVGENAQKIGIHADSEPAKITIQGRTQYGGLMEGDFLLSVLRGK